jgi:hypothetical protein
VVPTHDIIEIFRDDCRDCDVGPRFGILGDEYVTATE